MIDKNKILSMDPKGNLVVLDKNGLVCLGLNINTITEADQIEVFGDVILEVKTEENNKMINMKQDNEQLTPSEKAYQLSQAIIKDGFEFKPIKDLRDKKVIDVYTGYYNTSDYFGIPITLIITESNDVIINTYMVDEVHMDDMEAPPIESLRQRLMTKDDFLNLLLNKKLRINVLFAETKLPFIDEAAYDAYYDYIKTKKKEDEAEYKRQREYQRYLELKDKFEGE